MNFTDITTEGHHMGTPRQTFNGVNPVLRRVCAMTLTGLAALLPWSLDAADGPRWTGSAEDYVRSKNVDELGADSVFKSSVRPFWFADNTRFWYVNELAGGKREYWLVDAEKGTRQSVTDAERKAAVQNAQNAKKGAPKPQSEAERKAADQKKNAAADSSLKEQDSTQGPGSTSGKKASPDGKWNAFIKDNNVWLEDAKSDSSALSRDGRQGDAYGEIFWSPDSTRLIVVKTLAGDNHHEIYFVESSPKDQLQPKLHSHYYLKPGDRRAIARPHLFDVAARKEIPVSSALLEDPYGISEYRWEPDSKRFTFLFSHRGRQAMRVCAIDAATGNVNAIINEESKTFIEYFKQYYHVEEDTNEIIWSSDRDGWRHLYLYDAAKGAVKNQITLGDWVMRKVDRVDSVQRQIYFQASGLYPGQDPYYIHYCRVNFDGSGLVKMTEGDGTHSIQYSPDGKYIIDTYSRVDLPPVTELRRSADGTLVCELERADASLLFAKKWRAPERFVAKGRDGKTDIYGVILRPMEFDPNRKYPVIEHIYAGPHDSFVPKAWSWIEDGDYDTHSIAELGFVVVMIDGMGTSNRSKAFHEVCWKNLADSGFPDRILWMKAAAEKYPYMDVTRVGIYGGKAGGQNALGAMLFHPDFYKAAAADGGCHDNRMDKLSWNEQWMGWPVGKHYEEQSNVTNAHRLKGKLLLTVGAMDKNVDPASTMQVVNALIKADKDFEYIIFPSGGKGSGNSSYGSRRRKDFFVRSLIGTDPR